MRFLFLILGLFSSTAMADSSFRIPDPGKFTYTGQFEVLQKSRHEVVQATNEAGQARLDALRAENYLCEHKTSGTYLCRRHMPTENTEAEIAAKVEAEFASFEFEFGILKGDPEPGPKGDWLTEWTVPQSLRLGERTYSNYRYLRSVTELHRIFVGSPAEITFLPLSKSRIQLPRDFSVTESRSVFYRYFVAGEFKPD